MITYVFLDSKLYLYCWVVSVGFISVFVFFFQAEDGIRDLVRSRGLGDVYKRQLLCAVQVQEEAGFVVWPWETFVYFSVAFCDTIL